MKTMKKYSFFILAAISMLALGLSVACAPQEEQPDPRLLKLQQLKLEQIEQVNALLAELRTEMAKINSELAQPVEMKSVSNMSTSEMAASLRRPGLQARLTQLKEQEADLLVRKQYIEEYLELVRLLLKEE